MCSRLDEDLRRPRQVAVVRADVPHDGIAIDDRPTIARHLPRTATDANGRTAVDTGLTHVAQSIADLTRQFRAETGMTPSGYHTSDG